MTATAPTTEEVVELDTSIVHISELNTRPEPKESDPSIIELAASIGSPLGQSSPAVVRPHPKKKGEYELAAGTRRKVACIVAKKPLKAIVRNLTDAEFEDLILTDNLQREDPDPMMEAELIERRIEAGAEPSEIAARYGKDDIWLKRRMKLVSLTKKARAAWKPGKKLGHYSTAMMEFLGTLKPAAQNKFIGGWRADQCDSLKDLQRQIRGETRNLKSCAWLDDPDTFVKGCGPGCASNTADGLFPDPKAPGGSCANGECFAKRLALWQDKAVRKILGDKDINEFVLFATEWCREFKFDGKERKVIDGWEFKEAYSVYKKDRKGALAAIDVTKPARPLLRYIVAKSKKAKKLAANGGAIGKPKVDPKERLIAKRKAVLQESLAKALKKAPRPKNHTILKLVAAFGTDGNEHKEKWTAPARKPWTGLEQEDNATLTERLWKGVRNILLSRLTYDKNKDLVAPGFVAEFRSIADLIGYDLDAEYSRICLEEVKVPKSWAKQNLDPVTLKPIGGAKKKAAKKAPRKTAKKAATKTAKKA
jgi:ParB/RepB/Spo0J family partition protein